MRKPTKERRRFGVSVAGTIPYDEGDCFRLTEERCPLDSRHGHVHLREILGLDPARLAEEVSDETLSAFRAERAVFFDLETTGLSTGGGTTAFLVGAAHLEGEELVLRQYLLEDPAAEAAMLRTVHDHFREFEGVVSYNGKNFDLPILRNRLMLQGVSDGFDAAWHLDLLQTARRRWRGELSSCRLKEVERGLLGIRRVGDLEGYQIPPLYQDYLRTGSRALLDPVLRHNLLDVKSLVALTILAARSEVLVGDLEGEGIPNGRRTIRRAAPAANRPKDYRTAPGGAGRLPDGGNGEVSEVGDHRYLALRGLSLLLKRQGKWDKAVQVWKEMAADRPADLYSRLELAKYYEHRAGDPKKAMLLVERCLALIEPAARRAGAPASLKRQLEDLLHRRRRLACKGGCRG